MSEPIKVGDLVQVILPGCTDLNVGFTFFVTEIETGQKRTCVVCKGKGHGTGRKIYHGMNRPDGGHWFSESRLKVIPPFPELADEKHDEEIAA